MAITVSGVSIKEKRSSQANFVSWTTFDLDDDYPGTEGGYDLADVLDAALPGHEILNVIVEPQLPYFFAWNRVTGLLLVMEEDGTSGVKAPVVDATDLKAVTDLQVTIFSQ